MQTALLIINYNDAETTITLLNQVKDYRAFDYIMVVDNNSSDDSLARLIATYPNSRIEIVKSERNGGYGYAINFGCKYLSEKYGDLNVIVSNSDIVIKSNADIERMIAYKADDDGIVAPYINEHGLISRGWKLPSPLVDTSLNLVYIHRFIKPKTMYYPQDYYDHRDWVYVEAILGCFFLIDTKMLRKVNYFDECVFLYAEENIIGKKFKDAGIKTKVVCNVEVIHNHSVSIDKSINRINKYKQLKKSQYFFQKYYNHANILERFLYKLTAFLTYLILLVYYGVKR